MYYEVESLFSRLTAALTKWYLLELAPVGRERMDTQKDDNKPLELLKTDENLSFFSTLKVGGKAKAFVVVQSEEDVKKAFDFAEREGLQVFVLGGGSNVLFSDDNFEGLVIKNEIKGIEVKDQGGEVLVTCCGGENWDNLVAFSVSEGLYGLENLSGIPGTVGASPVQNIGAYGTEVKDTIFEVSFFDPKTKEFKTILNENAKFSYRNSIFKNELKGSFITKVSFLLSKKSNLNITYKDLSLFFKEKKEISLFDVRSAVLSIRSKKFPDLNIYGTAGSFFKNVILEKEKAEIFLERFPDTPFFEFDKDKVKIPTGFILDKICDLKGFREGNTGLFPNQSLVLVNFGGATSKEIFDFKEKIKKIVYEKTGIEIEEEVVYVGEK